MTTHASSAGRPALRLTRRGRLLLLLVLCALLVGAFSIGRVSSRAAGMQSHRPPTTVVHAGETLWAIALRVAPDRDPRAVVLELQRLNHLPTATVQTGQQIVLPAR